MSVMVMGIGNVVMCDDGIGVRVVRQLESEYRFPAGVELMDGGTLGLDLLPRLEGVQQLILVDAVATEGGVPGTLVRLAGEELCLALETRLSPHQVGLKDLLAVAELTDCLPREVVLLGVQPSHVGLGMELSPPVASQEGVLVDLVLEELRRMGALREFSRP